MRGNMEKKYFDIKTLDISFTASDILIKRKIIAKTER